MPGSYDEIFSSIMGRGGRRSLSPAVWYAQKTKTTITVCVHTGESEDSDSLADRRRRF